MRTKILSLILLTTFLLLATVSATVTFTVNPSTLVFTQALNSAEITIKNIGNETATFTLPSNIQISDGTDVAAVILNKYTLSLDSGASSNISASVNPSDIDKLNVGVYTINADIKAINTTSGENSTQTLTFKVHKSYCEQGPLNLSTIEIKSVDESGSSSDSDWAWYPQDNITLAVQVKNNDDDNDRTVRVEWDIYDTNAKEFLDVGDDDTIDINTNEDETAEFTFEVPYDLAQGNYLLYVKAYDDDDGEAKICSVAKDNGKSALLGEEEGISLQIKRDSHDVRVTKTNIPELLSCGSTSDIGLWIANLGKSREDKIKVTLLKSVFSDEISREISKLDWDDKAEEVSFPISVPTDLKEGKYTLKFKIDYDYDKADDDYNHEETVSYNIEVKGNCVAEQKQVAALITAELEEGAVAEEGGQLAIKGTLKNTGTATTTYDLSAVDYDSWATLDRIDTRSVTLDAGKSKDFSLYFTIKDNVKGEQFFTIKAVSGTETKEQEVSVVVEAKANEAISGITGNAITEHLRENWFIWVIVVINIVLIIAIILVARRIVAAK